MNNYEETINYLNKEFGNLSKLNNWITKLNLGFDVKVLSINNIGTSFRYEVLIPEHQSEPALFQYYIEVDPSINMTSSISSFDENKIGVNQNMNSFTRSLLRTLYYLKASLIITHRFLIAPTAMWDVWRKNTSVSKNELYDLYNWAKSTGQNVKIAIGQSYIKDNYLSIMVARTKMSSTIMQYEFKQKL